MKSLEEVRVSVLGKKGRITELMKSLGSLSIEEKKGEGPEPQYSEVGSGAGA